MYHIPDIMYTERMPPRAKRLFVETFTKYHKLNGGDEDVALHKARQALQKKYVKMNGVNNAWIPRKAAYEIVRDDLQNELSSTNTSVVANINNKANDRRGAIYSDRNDGEIDYDTDTDTNDNENEQENEKETTSKFLFTSNRRRRPNVGIKSNIKKRNVNYPLSSFNSYNDYDDYDDDISDDDIITTTTTTTDEED
jgi:hypothetical protein